MPIWLNTTPGGYSLRKIGAFKNKIVVFTPIGFKAVYANDSASHFFMSSNDDDEVRFEMWATVPAEAMYDDNVTLPIRLELYDK
jgi:hypothetical protein